MPYSRTGGAQSSSDDSGSDSDDECPLCMEPYEADDKMFYPCSCGYQVCRFCWHKIRSEENGLCPACRKEYSDTPAEYTPMSVKDVQLQKEKKKAKKAQKKAKEIDLRKSLVRPIASYQPPSPPILSRPLPRPFSLPSPLSPSPLSLSFSPSLISPPPSAFCEGESVVRAASSLASSLSPPLPHPPAFLSACAQ